MIDQIKHFGEPGVTTVIWVWHVPFWKEHLNLVLPVLSLTCKCHDVMMVAGVHHQDEVEPIEVLLFDLT